MLGKFLLKLLLNGFFIVPILMFFSNATLAQALLGVYAFSIMSYIVIDQLFLRLTNNAAATLADVGLIFIYSWMVEKFFFNWSLTFMNTILIAIVFGIIEFFMHKNFQRDPGKIGRKSFNDN